MTVEKSLTRGNRSAPGRSMEEPIPPRRPERQHDRGTGSDTRVQLRPHVHGAPGGAFAAQLIRRAALAALALLLLLPALASAHAELTAPTAPDAVADGQVRLLFDAPVETEFLRVQARDADGRVVSGPPRVDPADDQAVLLPVEEGATPAIVVWRVLSTDGHVTSGSLGEEAGDGGDEGRSVDLGFVLAGVGRGLLIAGLVMVAGLVVMRWTVVGPAWARGGVTPPGRPDDGDAFRERTFPVLEWAVNTWWVPFWTGVVMWALGVGLVTAGTLQSLDSWGWWTLISGTVLGASLVVLTVAMLATAAAGSWITRRDDGDDPLPPVWQAALLAGPAVVGLVTLSWTGHASTGGDEALNVALDAVHNLATAAWLGGLVGLLALLVVAGTRLGDADRGRLLAAGVVRFSTLGVVSVALLATTGVYRLLAELSDLDDLIDTDYGIFLLIKVAVFVVMLGVASVNRLVVHPHMERAALGLDPDDRGASALLVRSVRAELLLGVAVLVLVALLLSTAPPS
jgi:putative copper export protein/methionine-rich copper-binding protein CopC